MNLWFYSLPCIATKVLAIRPLEACKSIISLISVLIQPVYQILLYLDKDALFKEFSGIEQELQLHYFAL